ncbi:MAG: phosphodiesterase [Steroidobacterales bacterium]
MRILQFTDPHLFGQPGGTLRGIETDASLRACVAEGMSRFPRVAALLATGDIVHEDPQGYARFRRIFESVDRPVLCVPGNHDDPAAMQRELSAAPFVIGGAHRFEDWTLVMLDSMEPGKVGGRLARTELARLERELARSRDHHVMVCLHHHPVPMGSEWLDGIGLSNANEFWQLIDDYRHVRAVVWGHVHQHHDGRRGNVRLFATPSTGAQFLPASERYAIDSRPPAYRSFRLHPDGRIDSQTHWVDSLPARLIATG